VTKILISSGGGPILWAFKKSADIKVMVRSNELRDLKPEDVVLYRYGKDTITDVLAALGDWQPDIILHLSPEYIPVPLGMLDSPVPTACIIADWQYYLHIARIGCRFFDIILPVGGGHDAITLFSSFARKGTSPIVRPINYHGIDPHIFRDKGEKRDIAYAYCGCYKNPILYKRRYQDIADLISRAGLRCMPNTLPYSGYNDLLNRCRVVFHRNITVFPWIGSNQPVLAPRFYEATGAGCLVDAPENIYTPLMNATKRELSRDVAFGIIVDLLSKLIRYVNPQSRNREYAKTDMIYMDMFCPAAECVRDSVFLQQIDLLDSDEDKGHFKWLLRLKNLCLNTWQELPGWMAHIGEYSNPDSSLHKYPFLPMLENGLDECRLRVLFSWSLMFAACGKPNDQFDFGRWLSAQPDNYGKMLVAWPGDYHAAYLHGDKELAKTLYPFIERYDHQSSRYIVKAGDVAL
jgi:hypothetical protein